MTSHQAARLQGKDMHGMVFFLSFEQPPASKHSAQSLPESSFKISALTTQTLTCPVPPQKSDLGGPGSRLLSGSLLPPVAQHAPARTMLRPGAC